METMDLRKMGSFLSLAVGNDVYVNCKTKGYRRKISLSIMTGYLVFFVVGIFFGDLSVSQAINIEHAMSMMATVLVASLGTSILYNWWSNKIQNRLVSFGAVILMLTQAAYIFNLFSTPIVNSMFEIATIMSMLFLYGYVQLKDG